MKNIIVLLFLFCIFSITLSAHEYSGTNEDSVKKSMDKSGNKSNVESARVTKLKALLAQSQAQAKTSKQQVIHLTAKTVELKDSTGLVYVGAEVNKSELSSYLAKMKQLLGEDKFQLFRANQLARDQQGFHVTLINPFEYQVLSKKVKFGQNVRLTLQGLGKVAINNADLPKKNAESFFVVTSSSDGQFFRQQHLLKPKDFHITLGFNPHDIYSLSKGIERLVK